MATVEKEMGLLEVERSAPPVLVERQLQRLHRQGGGLEQAQDEGPGQRRDGDCRGGGRIRS
jgi:hypothetical protein